MRMRPRPCSLVIETMGFTRDLETGGPPGCSVPSAATRGPWYSKSTGADYDIPQKGKSH